MVDEGKRYSVLGRHGHTLAIDVAAKDAKEAQRVAEAQADRTELRAENDVGGVICFNDAAGPSWSDGVLVEEGGDGVWKVTVRHGKTVRIEVVADDEDAARARASDFMGGFANEVEWWIGGIEGISEGFGSWRHDEIVAVEEVTAKNDWRPVKTATANERQSWATDRWRTVYVGDEGNVAVTTRDNDLLTLVIHMTPWGERFNEPPSANVSVERARRDADGGWAGPSVVLLERNWETLDGVSANEAWDQLERTVDAWLHRLRSMGWEEFDAFCATEHGRETVVEVVDEGVSASW